MQLPKVDVIGTSVTALPFEEQIDIMLDWAMQGLSKVVCVANVHMLMESRWNANLRDVLERADLITPDGMPLVWMMRSLGIKAQDRVAGMDIFISICKKSSKQNIPVYLLGSTQEVLEKMRDKLKIDFPEINLVGLESPPFRPLTEIEDTELVKRVNDSGAGFIFVSLGCPKQECWMAAHQSKIKSVMIGVGGVFPVYAGVKKYAPKWIRESGLEWLYRLTQEPRRLWKRYWKTIPPFIWLAFIQLSSQTIQDFGFSKGHRSFRL